MKQVDYDLQEIGSVCHVSSVSSFTVDLGMFEQLPTTWDFLVPFSASARGHYLIVVDPFKPRRHRLWGRIGFKPHRRRRSK